MAVVTKNWRWYTDATPDGSMSALAAENTTPTLTANQTMRGENLRLRIQLRENAGAGVNPSVNIQISADQTNWVNIATQTIDNENRWAVWRNGAATVGNTIGSQLLTGTTSSGTYHENSSQAEAISASATEEIDCCIAINWAAPDTTLYFRILDATNPLGLDAGATYPSLTTCAKDDRLYTIDKIGTSPDGGQFRELDHAPWPRVFWDGVDRYWAFTNVPNVAENELHWWSWTGTGAWSSRQAQTMTGNVSTDSGSGGTKHGVYLKNISGTPVVGVFWNPSSGNITFKRGAISSGTLTFGSEVVINSADYGVTQHITIDDGNFWWIGGINGTTGVWAQRSTNADTGASWTSGFNTRKTVADSGVAANNIFAMVPIASDKVLCIWRNGAALKWATCTDAGGFSAVSTVTTTAAININDWGVCRQGDYVYLVHTDNVSSGGNHILRVYDIAGNSWSNGPGTNGQTGESGQNSNGDGIVLVPDGDDIYAFYTWIGPEGGQDRQVVYRKYAGPGASGTWDGTRTFLTPNTWRGNGDDISGMPAAGGGKIVILYLWGDCDTDGFPHTLEYHYLTLQATTTDAQAAYLRALQTVIDDQDAYLSGVEGAVDSQQLYLVATSDASVIDDQDAYLKALEAVTDDQDAYLRTHEVVPPDSQAAYLVGFVTTAVTDSQAAYLASHATIPVRASAPRMEFRLRIASSLETGKHPIADMGLDARLTDLRFAFSRNGGCSGCEIGISRAQRYPLVGYLPQELDLEGKHQHIEIVTGSRPIWMGRVVDVSRGAGGLVNGLICEGYFSQLDDNLTLDTSTTSISSGSALQQVIADVAPHLRIGNSTEFIDPNVIHDGGLNEFYKMSGVEVADMITREGDYDGNLVDIMILPHQQGPTIWCLPRTAPTTIDYHIPFDDRIVTWRETTKEMISHAVVEYQDSTNSNAVTLTAEASTEGFLEQYGFTRRRIIPGGVLTPNAAAALRNKELLEHSVPDYQVVVNVTDRPETWLVRHDQTPWPFWLVEITQWVQVAGFPALPIVTITVDASGREASYELGQPNPFPVAITADEHQTLHRLRRQLHPIGTGRTR